MDLLAQISERLTNFEDRWMNIMAKAKYKSVKINR